MKQKVVITFGNPKTMEMSHQTEAYGVDDVRLDEHGIFLTLIYESKGMTMTYPTSSIIGILCEAEDETV